jgi:uncharacterized protein (DUF58 family)
MLAEAVLTGWWVGYVLGIVVITAVVVLVAMILTLARRIGLQALAITEALEESRVNTMGLWNVDKANTALRSIVKGAQQARGVLEGTR